MLMTSTSSSVPSVEPNSPSPRSEGNRPQNEVQLTDQTRILPLKQVLLVFIPLSICSLVTTLDSVVVATSLPTVSKVFNAGSVSSWIPSAYLMTSTAFQPLYGRFSDIFGRKSALCIAMILYIIGNLIAGFSTNVIMLIVFRGVAGAGGGGITSVAQIIVSDTVSLRDRGKYIGYAAGFSALGYTVGPILGGALAGNASWKWCFWITLPLSVVATVIAIFFVPLKPVAGGMRQKLLIIDYVGVFLTLVGCVLIMLPLIWGGVTFPWSSAPVLAPLCSGFFVVALFCLWEWKAAKLPIVPMYIFKHMTVYDLRLPSGFVFFGTLYYLPQFFQVVLGYSPLRASIFLIPILASQVASTLIAGLAVSFTGHYRTIVYFGFASSAIACGCISIFTGSTPKAVMVVLMLLAGVGSGATMQTTTVAAQASVSRKDMSVVTAVRNFLRMLGGTFALPCAEALLNNALRQSMARLGIPDATIDLIINDLSILQNASSLGISSSDVTFILNNGYTKGFKDIFFMNAALASFAFICSVILIKHKELLRGDEDKLLAIAKEELKQKKKKKKSGQNAVHAGDNIELGDIDREESDGRAME